MRNLFSLLLLLSYFVIRSHSYGTRYTGYQTQTEGYRRGYSHDSLNQPSSYNRVSYLQNGRGRSNIHETFNPETVFTHPQRHYNGQQNLGGYNRRNLNLRNENIGFSNGLRLDDDVNGGINNQILTSPSPLIQNPAPATLNPAVFTGQLNQTCFEQCPTTAQYDPVCGTDGTSYINTQKLNCAETCGLTGLTMANKGFCDGNFVPHPFKGNIN